ncbi:MULTISPECIES: hypothetical protein [unclassified Campylobacter]|uniref:hypothetical protein n=1 Tax=unclassified Campylobacter TaxID=2593542 RepID=UPI0022E9BEF3|nr:MULTISPECIES: hypothetical protein [unclassified Campylobacter]MDA3079727.1 hypothetical protein [Campylobacter sp. CS_NA2]MDA3081513.1 hypothetical protein [Campylobacter sp. CS_NA1]MDA3085824.1 hypothetical protein [Campylobacter sp. CS_ED1]MDA3090559.1 hypothetical protein [Campylobacter sp. CS_ED2]WBR50660.1 hypothetical protein PF026_04695 [Campylobacter sp. CS_NA3]
MFEDILGLAIFVGTPVLLLAIIVFLNRKLKTKIQTKNCSEFEKTALYIVLSIAIVIFVCSLPYMALFILMSLSGAKM